MKLTAMLSLPALALLTLACSPFDNNPTASKNATTDTDQGTAQVTVVLDKVGSLAKTHEIALTRLCLVLSAFGADSIFDTLLVSGNANTSVSKSYGSLASLRQWSLSVKSLDKKDSVIHSGSTVFDVQPNKSTAVGLDLSARYAMVKARFYPIKDSVTRCSLYIDGVLRVDSSFAKGTRVGDTLKLAFDYLPTNAAHAVKLAVYGSMWGADTLLYSGDTTVFIAAGIDAEYHMNLGWKGPFTAPAGYGNLHVSLGTSPTDEFNGELIDSWKTLGLVAFYPFTNKGKDESGNGNDAAVAGATSTDDRFHNAGRAYHFNGTTDVLEAPDAPSLRFDTAVTAVVWAKPDRISGLSTLVGKWYSMDNFLLLIQDGYYKFSISMPGGNWGAVYSAQAKIDTAHANEWTQVAGVFDGKTVSIYVNGVRQQTVEAPGKLQPSTRPVTMGNHPSWNAYQGDLDGVRLYNRALGEEQISKLYKDGL